MEQKGKDSKKNVKKEKSMKSPFENFGEPEKSEKKSFNYG